MMTSFAIGKFDGASGACAKAAADGGGCSPKAAGAGTKAAGGGGSMVRGLGRIVNGKMDVVWVGSEDISVGQKCLGYRR